jgi:hypothetical protein
MPDNDARADRDRAGAEQPHGWYGLPDVRCLVKVPDGEDAPVRTPAESWAVELTSTSKPGSTRSQVRAIPSRTARCLHHGAGARRSMNPGRGGSDTTHPRRAR